MSSTVLDAGTVNIDANASFRNEYVTVDATPAGAGADFGFRLRATVSSHALSPFVSGSFDIGVGSYDSTTGMYSSTEAKESSFNVSSFFKYMWTRMQRLPFVVNPFDCNAADLSTATSSWAAVNNHDIYDYVYMFGFAGFRASDFRELVYQRSKERVAKGMNYVVDPFVAKSILLK